VSAEPEAPPGLASPAPALRPPSQGVWELAWPTTTLYALQAGVGVVDLAFVSSLGSDAVAAVGVATQLHFVVFAVLAAITTGAVAVVSRDCGRGDTEEAARATRCAVALAAGFGALLMLGIFGSARAIAWLGVDPEVVSLGSRCLTVLLLFNVPVAIELTLFESVRASGDVRTPLLVGTVALLINVVGDYALVFGRLGAPELGAVGSAWATGIAFSVSMAMIATLWLRRFLKLPPGLFRGSVTAERARRLLRVGLPTAAEQLSFQGGLLVFMGLVASFGTPAISAYLIGVRVLSFCFVPGFGFAMAGATLVGQNLGAERPDRAARAGWRGMFAAIGVMSGLGLGIVLLARPIVAIFGAAGDATVELSVVFVWILGAAQPLMAIEFALAGALRGAGDTRFPFLTSLLGLFVFRLGGAFFVAQPLFGTVFAVWCCLLADWGVKALLLLWRFAAGRWREIEV
jgi:putative MATE family efflux protein